ncbi:MAG: hypothetical protein DI547_13400 [Sphingobium sp.]|nr:MAG: hypothetical protein DI547_13400 [Sphingobium sp.]
MTLTGIITGALTLGSVAEATRPKADPAARLAKLTDGRTAGTPVDCLPLRNIRSSQIISRTAIVYEGMNGTLYVNRPRSGASFLHDGQILVTDTHSPDLCSIDIVRLVDSASRMPSGSIGLGPFVPYPRVPRPAGR